MIQLEGRESMNTLIWAVKHFELQPSNRKITITYNSFRHCRVSIASFVRQPFSKQLYTFTEVRPHYRCRSPTNSRLEYVNGVGRVSASPKEDVYHHLLHGGCVMPTALSWHTCLGSGALVIPAITLKILGADSSLPMVG